MSLDSPFGFIFFIFFLAPGLFFDFLSKRHKGPRRETQLQEFGKIVLASTSFSTLSVATIYVFRDFSFLAGFSFKEITENPFYYSHLHSELLLKFLVLSCFVALSYALIFDNFLIALSDPKYTEEIIWTHLFSNTSPKLFRGWRYPAVGVLSKIIQVLRIIRHKNPVEDIETAALITTVDGKSFIGIMALWSSEENIYGREIVLAPLNEEYLARIPDNFKEHHDTKDEWQKIWFPESSICNIKTIYLLRDKNLD